jgi:hypothetical protein
VTLPAGQTCALVPLSTPYMAEYERDGDETTIMPTDIIAGSNMVVT